MAKKGRSAAQKRATKKMRAALNRKLMRSKVRRKARKRQESLRRIVSGQARDGHGKVTLKELKRLNKLFKDFRLSSKYAPGKKLQR